MNRRLLVILIAALAGLAFLAAAIVYTQSGKQPAVATTQINTLERFNSPVIGPQSAPVTIVEFIDPACEACKAFHPIVKLIMARYPDKVRLVVRYAAFHDGSDEAVRIVEAGRKQGLFLPVLEALYAAQPQWASHGAPDLDIAWQAAAQTGLDLAKARIDAQADDVTATLNQEMQDVEALGVNQTPTFYVNGRELTDFGPQQLADLVAEEVEKAR